MLDTVLELLADERRRVLLYSMDEEDSDVFGYDELTEELVEKDILPEYRKDEFRVQLTHMHLPKLEDGGVIEHDKQSETIRYNADEDVSEILDFLNEYEQEMVENMRK